MFKLFEKMSQYQNSTGNSSESNNVIFEYIERYLKILGPLFFDEIRCLTQKMASPIEIGLVLSKAKEIKHISKKNRTIYYLDIEDQDAKARKRFRSKSKRAPIFVKINRGGKDFEKLVKYMLKNIEEGSEVPRKETINHGIDVIWQTYARKLIYVQCKNWSREVGESSIREFIGSIEAAKDRGELVDRKLFVSASGFKESAQELALKSQIELMSGMDLIRILSEHDLVEKTLKTFGLEV